MISSGRSLGRTRGSALGLPGVDRGVAQRALGEPGQPISKTSVSDRVLGAGLDDALLVEPGALPTPARPRGTCRSARPPAPSASAATRPRPSATPPAASTGTPPAASTTCGTSANVGTVPVWPPESEPCAITTSTPASTAASASAAVSQRWKTIAPAACAGRDPRRRVAEAGGQHVDALGEDRLDRLRRQDLEDHVDAGRAVVSPRIARMRATIASAGSPAAPVMPSPPAFVTAAASSALAIEPAPAPTIGRWIPINSQNGVRRPTCALLYGAMTFITTPDGVRLRVTDRGSGERDDRARARLEAVAPAVGSRDHAARAQRTASSPSTSAAWASPTSRTAATTSTSIADDLEFVLAELGLEDVTLVGWSMGCSRLAPVPAARRPRRRPAGADQRADQARAHRGRQLPVVDDRGRARGVLRRHRSSTGRPASASSSATRCTRPDPDLVNVTSRSRSRRRSTSLLKIVRDQVELDFRDLLPRRGPGARDLRPPRPVLPGRARRVDRRAVPARRAGVFEESAHYPFIEEKERFAQVLAEFASR